VASGVRRIEAVAGQAALEHMQALDGVVRQLAGALKVKGEELPARIAALQVCVVWLGVQGWVSSGASASAARQLAVSCCRAHATTRRTFRTSSRPPTSSWRRPGRSWALQRPW
jgi:hypothetical protein